MTKHAHARKSACMLCVYTARACIHVHCVVIQRGLKGLRCMKLCGTIQLCLACFTGNTLIPKIPICRF